MSNTLVRSVVVLLILAFAGASPALPAFAGSAVFGDKAPKVTLEEARKIALKKVPGTVDEEFSIEDEDGEVTDYIFYVKDKKGKVWEIQIGAEKGEIVSAELLEGEEDSEDPPANEEPPLGSPESGL